MHGICSNWKSAGSIGCDEETSTGMPEGSIPLVLWFKAGSDAGVLRFAHRTPGDLGLLTSFLLSMRLTFR